MFQLSKWSINAAILGTLVLCGVHFPAYSMEEDTVTLTLKDGGIRITQDEFMSLKEIVDPTLKFLMEKGAPYVLPSVDTESFEAIIRNIAAIQSRSNGKIREMLLELNNEYFPKVIKTANYLLIKSIDDFAEKSLKENSCTTLSESPYFFRLLLHEDLIRLYQPNFNEIDSARNTLLIISSEKGEKEIAQTLIRANADLDKQNRKKATALIRAAKKGHTDIVKELIGAGADLDKQDVIGATALIRAAMRGHKDIVELLINAGADIHKKTASKNTALEWAIGYALEYTMDKHSKAEAGLDDGDREAFLKTARENLKDIVKLLIDAGADFSERDMDGATALMIAVKNGHKDITEFLIKKEADINNKDKYFRPVVFLAILYGHKDIIELLIKEGADIHIQWSKYTNAYIAIQGCFCNKINRLFKEAGICPYTSDIEKHIASFDVEYIKALEATAKKETLDIVKLLMDSGYSEVCHERAPIKINAMEYYDDCGTKGVTNLAYWADIISLSRHSDFYYRRIPEIVKKAEAHNSE